MLGATVGFGVSGIFVIGGLHLTAPHEVMVSGTLAGAVLGPAARTAATAEAWLGVVLGLALLAIFIGAFVIGLEFALTTPPLNEYPAGGQPHPVVFAYVFAFGMTLFLGVFVLPLTVLASMVWMIVVVLIRASQEHIELARRDAHRHAT